jgi:hypothetical protein
VIKRSLQKPIISIIAQSLQSLGQWLEGLRIMIPFPEGARDFSLLQSIQTCSGAHPISYSMCIRTSFPGQGMKLNHSLPSRAKVKIAGSYTSTPLCAFMAYIWTT